jgi:hypothetical protein
VTPVGYCPPEDAPAVGRSRGIGGRRGIPGLETNEDDEIARLVALREAGTISWAEFDRKKAALLVQPERPEPRQSTSSAPIGLILVLVGAALAVAVLLAIAGR